MRLTRAGVFRADADCKMASKSQVLQLDTHSVAASTGDDPQDKSLGQASQSGARAGQKLRVFAGVGQAPDAVRFAPARAVEPGGAIDMVPIGVVVAREVFRREVDSKCLKHRAIGALVGPKRVEQRSVPIE